MVEKRPEGVKWGTLEGSRNDLRGLRGPVCMLICVLECITRLVALFIIANLQFLICIFNLYFPNS